MGQNTSTAVLEAVNTMTGGAFPMKDPLDAAGSCVFDDKAWQKRKKPLFSTEFPHNWDHLWGVSY